MLITIGIVVFVYDEDKNIKETEELIEASNSTALRAVVIFLILDYLLRMNPMIFKGLHLKNDIQTLS